VTPIWTTLGIARTGDRSAIRRAYAARLKETNPEDDPEGFKALREAYEMALHQAQTVAQIPGIVVTQMEADRQPQPDFADAPEDADSETPPPAVAAPSPSRDNRNASPRVRPPADKSYVAARRQLEAVLKPGAEATKEARRDALKALLYCPALESIEIREETEAWLLRMLVANKPRSDTLIAPTRRYFGWNEDKIDWRDRRNGHAALLQKLFAREKDLAALARLAGGQSVYRAAYKILSRPPVPDTFWTRLFAGASNSEIEKFLRDVRRERPHLESDLNAQAVAYWEARLDEPRFRGVHLWMAILGQPCLLLGLTILAVTRPTDTDSTAFAAPLAVLLAAPIVWSLCWLAYARLYVVPRRWWRSLAVEKISGWMRYGWGPALIGMFLCAAAPPSPWLAGALIFLAVGIGWWVAIVGEPEKSPGPWASVLRTLLVSGSLLAWWLFSSFGLIKTGMVPQISAAFATSVPVIGFGTGPLKSLWTEQPPQTRRRVLAGLIIVCLTAIAGLWLAGSHRPLHAPAFAFAAIALLVHKVPSYDGQAWSGTRINVVIGIAALLCLGISQPWTGAAVLGSVLLLRATINCLSSFQGVNLKPKKRPGLA